MNVFGRQPSDESLAGLFRVLSQPARLKVLLAIGNDEACVCHLEAALGLRQAYISQQLMVLRDAGLVESIREGRNIYYRLLSPQVLDLVARAAVLLGQPDPSLDFSTGSPLEGCPCPHCAEASGVAPDQARDIACDC